MQFTEQQAKDLNYILEEYVGYTGGKDYLIKEIGGLGVMTSIPNKLYKSLSLIKTPLNGKFTLKVFVPGVNDDPAHSYRVRGLQERVDQIICVSKRFNGIV